MGLNTPAHMALGLAVLGREARRGEWIAILAGAMLPDLAYFLGWAVAGRPEALRLMADLFNSLPLWLVALGACLLLRQRTAALLCGGALLHILTDLPLHATDAHAHFWPLTDWRWQSPVSFWDADYHGRIAGVLEGVLFAACLAAIWPRLEGQGQKALTLVFALVYAMAFVHFVGHAFAGQHWAIW